MRGFIIRSAHGLVIRFMYYEQEAPVTVEAFHRQLPFKRILMHARISGSEIWTDDAPALEIIQENSSIFTLPGEVVIGPVSPTRVKTARCLGIYYGEGKGVDGANIFGRVFEDDNGLLRQLGEQIWKDGQQEIEFEALSN